ncbi:hypothetical protein ElP_07630 [Tautonia plasticadhaerens]|uniref:Uncharacterized protein n=1 Tax=Tautonia plasticadhaerens TaxID=2527974 RepID=A0A518GWJ1_9BACT|nr:hypothetical protein ElP_07630 [Tautonia plasticadhaerens]
MTGTRPGHDDIDVPTRPTPGPGRPASTPRGRPRRLRPGFGLGRASRIRAPLGVEARGRSGRPGGDRPRSFSIEPASGDRHPAPVSRAGLAPDPPWGRYGANPFRASGDRLDSVETVHGERVCGGRTLGQVGTRFGAPTRSRPASARQVPAPRLALGDDDRLRRSGGRGRKPSPRGPGHQSGAPRRSEPISGAGVARSFWHKVLRFLRLRRLFVVGGPGAVWRTGPDPVPPGPATPPRRGWGGRVSDPSVDAGQGRREIGIAGGWPG